MSAVPARDVADLAQRYGVARLLPAIARYVAQQRWSGARGSGVVDVELADAGVLIDGECTILFTVVRARLDARHETRFALPIGLRPLGDPLAERAPGFMIGEASLHGHDVFAYDAAGDPLYIHWLWNAMRESRSVRTARAELRFAAIAPDAFEDADPDVRWLGTEQSNTSMALGGSIFLKHLRRVEGGPSHELEMAEALDLAGFRHMAPLVGTALYQPDGSAPTLLALAQPYLHNGAEGWALALTSLRDLYAQAEEAPVDDAAQRHAVVEDQGGAFTAEAGRLGAVVAEMHTALAQRSLPEALAPVPLTKDRLREWADAMAGELDSLLGRFDGALDPLRLARTRVEEHFAALQALAPGGLCTRVHGDLHLGQVMRTDSGWYILDFEGEPNRSAEQRRERSSPLRDVAAMLRSFDYAAAAGLVERTQPGSAEYERLRGVGDAWAQINREAFWAAYLDALGAEVLPAPGAALTLVRAFEVQKAVYEVGYELGHRPSWAHIPLDFLLRGAE